MHGNEHVSWKAKSTARSGPLRHDRRRTNIPCPRPKSFIPSNGRQDSRHEISWNSAIIKPIQAVSQSHFSQRFIPFIRLHANFAFWKSSNFLSNIQATCLTKSIDNVTDPNYSHVDTNQPRRDETVQSLTLAVWTWRHMERSRTLRPVSPDYTSVKLLRMRNTCSLYVCVWGRG